MDIHEFGSRLVETGDLDPVYYLARLELEPEQLARWLLAYWCFYHAGAASWLSERGEDYWPDMVAAAANTAPSPLGGRWPRAAERRHFRGPKCVAAVRELWGGPLSRIQVLEACRTEREVMNKVETWPMFGPWISFKAADMMERVWGAPLAFAHDTGLLYREPRAGLQLLAGTQNPRFVYERLLLHFQAWPAPPLGDRACGPQEIETILCKWKSHMGGRYEVGKDLAEVRHALSGWGKTAGRMLDALP